ncbi:hypothetical protein [Chthonobacter albigriseus]|uniref:hypothetical protein n=1 Tax=Chthonobacter albigriseus TaxID=1683161 RepID=UPI0015EF2AE6|nr:hypothetical protein [Chthonobacter albigriseus]
MTEKPAGGYDWEAIRTAYEESDERVEDIARRHGLHRITIQGRAARMGWKPRNGELAARIRASNLEDRPPPDLAALVLSLQRTTARVVTAMEARLGRDGDGIEERDVRALGTLAGALSRIIDLDLPQRRPRDHDDPDAQARDDLARRGGRPFRDALAARIEAIVGGPDADGLPERADADGGRGAAEGLGDARPSGPDPA